MGQKIEMTQIVHWGAIKDLTPTYLEHLDSL